MNQYNNLTIQRNSAIIDCGQDFDIDKMNKYFEKKTGILFFDHTSSIRFSKDYIGSYPRRMLLLL